VAGCAEEISGGEEIGCWLIRVQRERISGPREILRNLIMTPSN